jgi:hypothetical protein
MFFMFVFAVPECIYFGNSLRMEGLLTLQSALVMVFVACALGLVVGALGWFTIFKGLRR